MSAESNGTIVHESTVPPPAPFHICDVPVIENAGVWKHNPGTIWRCGCGLEWTAGADRMWWRSRGRWRRPVSTRACGEGFFASMTPAGGSPPPTRNPLNLSESSSSSGPGLDV